jgi:hypothetical protein
MAPDFYRCAFQVNTYENVVRHNHPTLILTKEPITITLR